MYRVLVRKEIYGRTSGRWEIILIFVLKNLKSSIKKVLKWLRDLDFMAEDRDK